VSTLAEPIRREGLTGELAKLAAFLRRDLLIAWSYRVGFLSDWAGLAMQVTVFYLIGRIVDPGQLPSYGGTRTTYMEFVAVGIAVGVFVQVALTRVALQVRQEQLTGTLEALLLTPTRPSTIQLGSVAYDLMYIPIRTAIFLAVVGAGFGLEFRGDGVAPAALILVAFIPFVWGLGIVGAATTLTVRRGSNAITYLAAIFTIGSGSYFPLGVLPGWAESVARLNPMALAVSRMRRALLAGIDSGALFQTVGLLALASAVSLAFGIVAFRFALARESRRGTLGQY
jgi:ABC-2 type transport system permease protein